MSIPPRAHRGEILLYRDGLLFRDYGDTRLSSNDYGDGLKAAVAAMSVGDTLLVGPGVYNAVDVTMTAARAKAIFNGSVIYKRSGSDYDHLFKSTGDDCVIQGLSVDGDAAVNATGTGYGIHITGDRTRLLDASAESTRGQTVDSGHGSTVKIDDCNDVRVERLYSKDAGYTGLWLNKTPRFTCDGGYVLDAADKGLSVNSSVDLSLISISNWYGLAVTPGTFARWNTNIDEGITLGEMRLNNVHLTDTDMISAGVSYEDESSQMFKFQNIRKMIMNNSSFVHGSAIGVGPPAARTIYMQSEESPGETNTPPEEWYINLCSFASAIVCELKLPYLIAKQSHFGSGNLDDYNELFYRLRANYAKFEDCIFNTYAKTQVLEMGSDVANTDRYEFVNNRFTGESASSIRFMSQDDDVDLTTLAGCFLLDETNTFENTGAGEMYRSDNVNANLILTTNKNGDLLFDDTLIATNEIQSFYVSNASSGTFTLTYSGQTTGNLAWNISAGALKTALELLSTIDLVDVTGSGTSGSPWLVEFQGDHEGVNVSLMTADGALLVGSTPTVSTITVPQAAVGNGKHPNPGAGPTYFPRLDAPANGKRIWNINWTPDATQVIPEKGWISHGGAWVEMT